ncbi:hypothetical protein B296_00001704 [Ensete ventricosum]|uniref:Uncharacterized protein n=1 Tax=Ensete ventricosum TaxID=4639 RepID=A0A426ZW61_ENSVE|nr:hypothetical protein B296_00001704 [Ensete ventricosum]
MQYATWMAATSSEKSEIDKVWMPIVFIYRHTNEIDRCVRPNEWFLNGRRCPVSCNIFIVFDATHAEIGVGVDQVTKSRQVTSNICSADGSRHYLRQPIVALPSSSSRQR